MQDYKKNNYILDQIDFTPEKKTPEDKNNYQEKNSKNPKTASSES